MRQRKDELITLADIRVEASTAKAILVRDCDGSENWIPRSHIRRENNDDGGETTIGRWSDSASGDEQLFVEKGDEGDLVITKWIAEQKGLA